AQRGPRRCPRDRRRHHARGRYHRARVAGRAQAVRSRHSDERADRLRAQSLRRTAIGRGQHLVSTQAAAAAGSRLRTLTAEVRLLEEKLRQGGGPAKIERQHEQGKLTARERIALLLDPRTALMEIGLLVAHDQYDGQAPAAGVVTGIGWVHDRPVVIIANDATVKAGSWWPETITKMLRAQEH